jgi:O-antigen ligase
MHNNFFSTFTWPSEKKIDQLSIATLFVYIITIFSFKVIHNIAGILLLVVFIYALSLNFKKLKHEKVFILLLATLIIQTASWYNSLSIIPTYASSGPALDRLAKLFLFIPMAIVIGGREKVIISLWGAYFVALILGGLSSPTLHVDIINAFRGYRVDFGIKNEMYSAAFSGLCIIGSIHFIIEYLKSRSNKKSHFILWVNFLIIFISSTILIASQSRMTYLAFVFLMITYPMFYYKLEKNYNSKLYYLITSYIALAFLGYFIAQIPLISDRFINEFDTLKKLAHFDFSTIPMNSSGIRINAWIESASLFIQHPFIGMGRNSAVFMFENSKLFLSYSNSEEVNGIRHLHNSFVEYLLFYGIAGFITILSIYWICFYNLIKYKKYIPNSSFWIKAGFLFITYWLIINNFESFNARRYGVATHNLMLASFFSLYWQAKFGNTKLSKEEK